MDVCQNLPLSVKQAKWFILEICKDLIDPQDLSDFRNYEKEESRIILLANNLCTQINSKKVQPPTSMQQPKFAGIPKEIKEPFRKIELFIEQNSDKSLESITDFQHRVHALTEKGILNSAEATLLLRHKQFVEPRLQKIWILKHNPDIKLLLATIQDKSTQETVLVALEKKNVDEALLLLIEYLKQCTKFTHRIKAYIVHQVAKLFGKKKIKCSGTWERDVQVIKNIAELLKKNGTT